MNIIDSILNSPEFRDQPPVLIDIGASGEINSKWKAIAPYAVCLAFDADDRDFQVNEKTDSIYKKLISFNRIVTADTNASAPFYLTSSPYCSSLLRPLEEKLTPWVFSELFKIDRTEKLPVIQISQALLQAEVDYIDWFKTDTQGTDLRLFRSLPKEIATGLLACEFEPGIIDAYDGEDKLFTVMKEMHEKDFWLSTMHVRGTQRLNKNYANMLGVRSVKRSIRISPCWAEVTYLRQAERLSKRQLLLLIVFAIIEKQFGYALEVCDSGISQYQDRLFEQSKSSVIQLIKTESWKNPLVIIKRQFNKLLAEIND